MTLTIAAGWVRLAMATLVLAVLVPLLALWSTLQPDVDKAERAPASDPLAMQDFAKTLAEDVLRQAVLCVGDAAAAHPDPSGPGFLGALKDCQQQRWGLTAIYGIAATTPVRLPASTDRGLAGDEPFGAAGPQVPLAIAQAAASGRVVHTALPEASGGRSRGVDQIVPLDGQPARVLVLRHRLSQLPRELLDKLGRDPQPALLVDAGPDSRGTLVPRNNGLRLVSDGNSWRPEWTRSRQGLLWLLSGLTGALLAAGLATMKIVEKSERFRSDIERAVPVGLRTMDRRGRILWANPAFLALSGWPADQIIGRGPPYVYWDDATRAERQDQLESVMGGNAPSATYTASFVRPDGSSWLARVNAHELDKGKGWMLACVDISEEALAAQRTASLLQALSRLELKAELFRQLEIQQHGHASTVAACALRLESAVASMEAHDWTGAEEKSRTALDVARKARAQALQLLQASKPEEPQLLTLWEAVEDGINAAQPLLPNSNTQFINSVDKDLPGVRLPRGVLVFIVSNLVHNGVRAMAGERLAQRRLTVFSDVAESMDQVHVLVEDHGCGMTRAQRDQAFQLGVSGYAEGNGFGLYNSRELARAWGGDLVVLQSATTGPLRGTTMQLTLPLARDAAIQDTRHG